MNQEKLKKENRKKILSEKEYFFVNHINHIRNTISKTISKIRAIGLKYWSQKYQVQMQFNQRKL